MENKFKWKKNHWYCEQCNAEFNEYPTKGYDDICPVCGRQTDFAFFDCVGGVHSGGVGWSPNGDYCGECCRSCEECGVWK